MKKVSKNDCLPTNLTCLNHHRLLIWKDSFDAIHCAPGSTERTTLPQVMIKGFNFRKEKLLLLWLKGVDEGLSSLLLQCLGIETMPVPHQRGPFKSILQIMVSFLSSSLKRPRIINRALIITQKYESNLQYSEYEIINSKQTCVMH